MLYFSQHLWSLMISSAGAIHMCLGWKTHLSCNNNLTLRQSWAKILFCFVFLLFSRTIFSMTKILYLGTQQLNSLCFFVIIQRRIAEVEDESDSVPSWEVEKSKNRCKLKHTTVKQSLSSHLRFHSNRAPCLPINMCIYALHYCHLVATVGDSHWKLLFFQSRRKLQLYVFWWRVRIPLTLRINQAFHGKLMWECKMENTTPLGQKGVAALMISSFIQLTR